MAQSDKGKTLKPNQTNKAKVNITILGDIGISGYSSTSSGTSGEHELKGDTGVGISGTSGFNVAPSTEPPQDRTNVEDAIMLYLQALRALDRTHITITDIAEALSLSIGEVTEAIEDLQDEGVRLL